MQKAARPDAELGLSGTNASAAYSNGRPHLAPLADLSASPGRGPAVAPSPGARLEAALSPYGAHHAPTVIEQRLGGQEEADPPLKDFFDPELSELRVRVYGMQIAGALFLSVVFAIVCLFFIGSGWNPSQYYSNVSVAILDADGGPIGALVRAVAAASPTPTLGWTVVDSTLAPRDLVSKVNEGGYNAALIVNPGASRLLLGALSGAVPAGGYNPLAACDFVFDEGRAGVTMAQLLRAFVPGLVATASAAMASKTLSSLRAGNVTLAAMDSKAFLTPIGYTEENLHFVEFSGIHTAVGITYLDTWVIMLFVTNVMNTLVIVPLDKVVRRDHVLIYCCFHMIATPALLSLWPCVIVHGLGATQMTPPLFFAIWAWTWLAMTVFGGIIAIALISLGVAFGNVASFIVLIMNLVSSTGILPLELMPPFFQIGYGLPMFNGAAGARTILLGSYDRLDRNVGVMFAWLGVIAGIAGIAVFRARPDRILTHRVHHWTPDAPLDGPPSLVDSAWTEDQDRASERLDANHQK